jgi:single-strand DNA-binding protein
MPNGIYTTVIGNLVADPELRFTQNGTAVGNITIANTPTFMKDGEWVEGETTFVRCNVWGKMAENVSESFNKGEHVIAYGRIAQRTYEDREGETRYVWEMTVDDMGPTVRFGTVVFTKHKGGRAPVPEEKNKAVKRAAKPRAKSRTAQTPRTKTDPNDPFLTDYDGDDE